MTGLQQNILIDLMDRISDAILDGRDYKYVVDLIELLKVSHDGFYAYSPQAMPERIKPCVSELPSIKHRAVFYRYLSSLYGIENALFSTVENTRVNMGYAMMSEYDDEGTPM